MANLYERTRARQAAQQAVNGGGVGASIEGLNSRLLSSVLDDSDYRRQSSPQLMGESGDAYMQRVGTDAANAKGGYENRLMHLSDWLSRQKDGEALNPANMIGTLNAQSGGFAPSQMERGNRFEAGLSSNEARLSALLDNPESVQQTAAYKFRLGQGQEALQRQMAAKGMLGSGNRLMELTKYGQDMASQEYDTQAKRLSDLVGMYSGNWVGDKNANTARFGAEADAGYKQGQLGVNRFGAMTSLMDVMNRQKSSSGSFRMGGGQAPAFDANPFDNPVTDWNSLRPSTYKG